MPDQGSTHTSHSSSQSFWHKHQFWLFIIAGAMVRKIPYISIPFNWLESYFHEIGHGLAAIATGGKVISIQLFTNGAGLCTTQGGQAFWVTFMGYAGAIIWGTLIYTLAGQHKRLAQIFSAFIVVLLGVSLLFWARDLLTMIILVILLILVLLTLKVKQLSYLQKIIQFLGVIVLLNSLFSPLYLLDGRDLGDGAALANLTGLPELFWVVVWSGLALFAIYFLLSLIHI